MEVRSRKTCTYIYYIPWWPAPSRATRSVRRDSQYSIRACSAGHLHKLQEQPYVPESVVLYKSSRTNLPEWEGRWAGKIWSKSNRKVGLGYMHTRMAEKRVANRPTKSPNLLALERHPENHKTSRLCQINWCNKSTIQSRQTTARWVIHFSSKGGNQQVEFTKRARGFGYKV